MLPLLSALLIAVQASGLKLEGRVVDAQGAPRPAHVVVGGQPGSLGEDPFELLAAAVAGEDGRFELELPRTWIDRTAGYRPLEVFAYLEGHGIARQNWDLADVPAGMAFELRLPRAATSRLRFVDPQGRPVVGARAWVQALDDPIRFQFRMPVAWWREHASVTDAEGWVTLPASREELAGVGLEGEGLGLQLFGPAHDETKPLPEVLEVIRAAERALEIAEPVPADARITVESYRAHEEDPSRARYWVTYAWELAIAAGQPVRILAPLGQPPRVRLTTPDAAALTLCGMEMGEGESTWRLTRPPTYRVNGRTVDALSGAPVAGVQLEVRADLSAGWVKSGEGGRFSFECGARAVSIHFYRGPQGYAHEESFRGHSGQRPADGSDLELGDLPLAPSWTAKGSVRGTGGEPLAGAWVVSRQSVPDQFGTRWFSLSTLTDEAGRYELKGALQGVPLELVARSGDLRASVRQNPGEPLELALSPALCARGVAREAGGDPVADLELEIWHESKPNVSGAERVVVLDGNRSFRTNAHGVFSSGSGLEAEARYCLVWSDPRFEHGRSAWFSGAELDGAVELTLRSGWTARGKILASDGSPMAGAEVRARRGSSSAVAAEDGSFELPGVSADGDVLIVRAADGVPRTRWVAPTEAPLEWRLESAHALEAPLAAAPPAPRARELELAIELLEVGYRSALEAKDESKLLRAVQNLAWADPALALERVESGLFETDWMRDFALTYVGDALRGEAPEESLAVTRRLERGMSRALSTLASAARLERAAELEQLALVRAEARAVDPPEHRAVVLANLADRLLDLGEREAALDVLAEGRAVAESLPGEDWPAYARGCVGEVLARVDLKAGRELIDGIASAEDRGRHVFNTAHELAASDPSACQALFEEQAAAKSGSWRPERYISRIAHRMAPADLARAKAMAATYDPSGFADGMVALALAESDPREARSALEVAFQRAETHQHDPARWYEHPLLSAAALLPVAERVDPTQLRTYVARVLALRPPQRPERFGGEKILWCADATLAFYVARWEPDLAKSLIAPVVEAARELRGSELDDLDPLWAALAAVDPEWAAAVAREFGGRATALTGRVLAMPPDERADYVQDEIFYLWIVGKEDL